MNDTKWLKPVAIAALVLSSALPAAAGTGLVQDELIYADHQLEPGWTAESNADYSLASTTYVYSGKTSIRFVPDGWQYLYLWTETVRDVFDYAWLRFKAHGGPAGANHQPPVDVILFLGQSEIGIQSLSTFLPPGGLTQGNWVTVQIPLSIYRGDSWRTFDAIPFDAHNGFQEQAVYFDEIELISAGLFEDGFESGNTLRWSSGSEP